jgi:hypothetical protein
VQQAHRLEHDGIANLARRGARLVSVADEPGIGERDARRTAEFTRIPVVGGCDRLLRLVGQSRQWPGFGGAVQHGQGRGGVLDCREHRDAGVGKHSRGLALVAHAVRNDRFAVCVSNFRHAGCDVDLRAGQALAVVAVPAEVAGDENRVDLRAREHRVEHGDERGDVLLARAGQVDGVGDSGRRRQ